MKLVVKADGSRQEFDRNKIIRTCLKLHVTQEQAEEIASRIESKLYEGITTKNILKMIFAQARKYWPEIRHRGDLRHAISKLRSKPDFEEFVRVVLREHGYDVKPNEIVFGRCVEHEIDGIAKKGDETIYLEVKHHIDYHSYTGLHVFLESFAALEDVIEGENIHGFNELMIVCNTKMSEHARRYAKCKGIRHLSWNYPGELSLSELIDSKKLYPVTILKALDPYTQKKLGDNGIVTLKQLAETDFNRLLRLGIGRSKLSDLVSKARTLIDTGH